jgi:hypothetical protein
MNNRLLRQLGSAVIVTGLLLGCSGDNSSSREEPPIPVAPAPVHHAEASVSASGSHVLKVGPYEKDFERIRFSIPAGWKEVQLSPQQQGFIDARYEIPTPHGDVSLTCSSNSGGIDTNIHRWIGQFQLSPETKPDIEPLEVNGKTATWVDMRGEFVPGPMAAGSSPTGPIERMIGVAIPLGSGDFYLKLTGTDAAVADARTAFRKFARDARFQR